MASGTSAIYSRVVALRLSQRNRTAWLLDLDQSGHGATMRDREVSAITRIRRRGRHRRYGRGGLSSGPSRCSASISLQRATQSLQIATPGPARTASTCPAVLEQKEHLRDGSEPWSRGSVSKDRLGRTGLGRTGSNLTGLLPSALGLGAALSEVAPIRQSRYLSRTTRLWLQGAALFAGVHEVVRKFVEV